MYYFPVTLSISCIFMENHFSCGDELTVMIGTVESLLNVQRSNTNCNGLLNQSNDSAFSTRPLLTFLSQSKCGNEEKLIPFSHKEGVERKRNLLRFPRAPFPWPAASLPALLLLLPPSS